MDQRIVEVTTPSRLHFGFLTFGHQHQRQFGGVGVMLSEPRVRLVCEPAGVFSATGAMRERVREFARRWSESHGERRLPGVRIRVLSVPQQHVGLGVGTQLGLAVASGLTRWSGRTDDSLDVLARRVGRGLRSSVGTYGFRYGGLIAENGKLSDEALGQLVAQVELPAAWRFILFRPRQVTGLAGRGEQQAFGRLPPVDERVRDRLWRELVEGILPAAQTSDIELFGESVYRYGRQAGMCFAACQGGAFANRDLAHWVERVRSWGVKGVGQSSWGPTLFAVVPDQASAERFAARLHAAEGGEALCCEITQAAQSGASITERKVAAGPRLAESPVQRQIHTLSDPPTQRQRKIS